MGQRRSSVPEMPVAGLSTPLVEKDLYVAEVILTRASKFNQPLALHKRDETLRALARIIQRHALDEVFGVALIQRPAELSPDEVIVGEDHGFLWNKSMEVKAVNLARLCGQSFKVTEGGSFVAYKFGYGPLPGLQVSEEFFKEFAKVVLETNNRDVVGLQVLAGIPSYSVQVDCANAGSVLIPLNETDMVSRAMSKHDATVYESGWNSSPDHNGSWDLRAAMFTVKYTIKISSSAACDTQSLVKILVYRRVLNRTL
ncbi:hypothetical protein CBER1_10553 [Cercospora berteroae]|uniref:Uncharacterized protein n=1 Tax=Cercospora berteroae TaxID=357750 RepID=A0A2S6CJ33_9PEZI|nr:hypothetical protein CBER1_10553 [Cercospora berteroae]